jgi:hypothetical protein
MVCTAHPARSISPYRLPSDFCRFGGPYASRRDTLRHHHHSIIALLRRLLDLISPLSPPPRPAKRRTIQLT